MNELRQRCSFLSRCISAFICAAAILTGASLLAGCEGMVSVAGKVIDDSTKAPITGAIANLSLDGFDYPPDTTEGDGWFDVETFLVGMMGGPPRVTLEVRKDGYKTYERELGEYEHDVTVVLKRE